MHSNKKRGFTLIELLVVIAIIGILSSVVLASLNTARDKGRDAATKSSMQTVRVQSEIYYDGTGNQSYGTAATTCLTGMFSGDTTIAAAIAQITGTANVTSECFTGGTGVQEWAMSATLLSPTSKDWCVDYTGQAKEITALDLDGTTCP